MTHQLKSLPQFFNAVVEGKKTFEIRNNDRDFKVGDQLLLKEWDGRYTGRIALVNVGYITDFEQKDGFVVMSIYYTVNSNCVATSFSL